MLAPPVLSLSDVTVAFGGLKAVNGVSLQLQRGERRAVLGPNGAGKTTLFNAITGSTSITEGRVVFEGHDMTRMSPQRRAHLGVSRTFQITNLFAELSVMENMRLAARGLSWSKFSLFGQDRLDTSRTAQVEAALATSHLVGREAVIVREMSYGEQRQLEVAMALVGTPRLLLLDEPAAGLSPAERSNLAAIIRNLPRDLTVVLIEHDMDLALGLVDSVTVMQNGRVIVEASPDEIRHNPLVQEVDLGKPHQIATTTQGGAGDAASV